MNIENYFVSDSFYNELIPISTQLASRFYPGDTAIGEIIHWTIQYSILFAEEIIEDELSNFVRKIVQLINSFNKREIDINSDKFHESIIDLFCEELFRKNNVSIVNEKNTFDLCKLAYQKLFGRTFKYHAFNSAFLDSIKENGISPSIRVTPIEEITKVHDIIKKYVNSDTSFGWLYINCIDKVSFSYTSRFSYHYGMESPEWFTHFVLVIRNEILPSKLVSQFRNFQFDLWDYKRFKSVLSVWMNKHNFSNNDAEIVMDFFLKQWKIYENSTPILAMIEEKVDEDINEADFRMFFDSFGSSLKNFFDMLTCTTYYSDAATDMQTKETIDTKDAVFIQMPRYDKLVERVTSIVKGEKTDSEELQLYRDLRSLVSELDTSDNNKKTKN